MAPTDANINFAQCLKTTTDLGVFHIHNICSDVVRSIPWGAMDWAAACFFICLGLAFLAMISAFTWTMVSHLIGGW